MSDPDVIICTDYSAVKAYIRKMGYPLDIEECYEDSEDTVRELYVAAIKTKRRTYVFYACEDVMWGFRVCDCLIPDPHPADEEIIYVIRNRPMDSWVRELEMRRYEVIESCWEIFV